MKSQPRLSLQIVPLRPRWISLAEILDEQAAWCDELDWLS